MPRYSAPDNLWTLLQTNSTRGLAVKLGVDRRTIQRWKNQGQQPVPKNEKLLAHEAAADRTIYRRRARAQGLPYKALPVALFSKRNQVGEEVSLDEFVKLKARSKTNPKFASDRFHAFTFKHIVSTGLLKREKDESRDAFRERLRKAGRKYYRTRTVRKYFRYQYARTFQYDVQRAPDYAIIALMLAHRGEGRVFSIVYLVLDDYLKDDGTAIEKGSHSATAYDQLDSLQFNTPEKIQHFLNGLRDEKMVRHGQENRVRRRLVMLRLSDTDKR